MTRPPQQVRIGYFGKIPAHSDFIKGSEHIALVAVLDQWLAAAINLLSTDPRWKRHYDAQAPLHFAFIGTRSRRAIAGRVVASSDRSGRRFPFLMMSVLEIEHPGRFVPASPLVLAGLWQRLETLSKALLAAPDPAPVLRTLAASVVELDPGGARHAAGFDAFLDGHTLASLRALLAAAGFRGTLRQLLLALGLLLRPVADSGPGRLENSLALPLPCEAGQGFLVASFWLHLITPFLRTADVELGLFFTERDGVPVMVLGFCGAAPHTLQAIIDPAVAAERQIGFEQMEWVDGQLGADPRARRLSACLERDQLSLRAALALLHETFL
jgi:type VI secretion system protein ImpM